MQNEGDVNRREVKAEVSISVSGKEIEKYLKNFQIGVEIRIPTPQDGFGIVHDDILINLFDEEKIDFKYCVSSNGTTSIGIRSQYRYPVIDYRGNEYLFSWFKISTEGKIEFLGDSPYAQQADISIMLIPYLFSQIYIFNAERFNVGVCDFGDSSILSPDSRNLPEVLNHLSSNNRRLYDELIDCTKRVIDSITAISVVPRPNSKLEIVVWQEEMELLRPDLAISLSDSGTGVGQVLSMLYVVLSNASSKTIVIDEPSNFLHPGATRQLMSILSQYPKHQYIMTTHSAEVIKSVNPSTIHLVKRITPQSVVESVNASDIDGILHIYQEVGVRLSDVFGADNVLWVEGQTEEIAFKILLNSIESVSKDITVAAVMATGDFDKSNRVNLITDIYRKLSSGNGLLPVPVGFIFDREERTDEKLRELVRLSNGKITFISRRQFENYLIQPDALVNVINSLQTFLKNPIAVESVLGWIENNGKQSKYIKNYRKSNPLSDSEWHANVDAAKLLTDLFIDLSNNREIYRKTVHSVQLMEWILKNRREDLQDLITILESFTS